MATYNASDAPKIKTAVEQFDALVSMNARTIQMLQGMTATIARYPKLVGRYRQLMTDANNIRGELAKLQALRNNFVGWLSRMGAQVNSSNSSNMASTIWGAVSRVTADAMRTIGLGAIQIPAIAWIVGILATSWLINRVLENASGANNLQSDMQLSTALVSEGYSFDEALVRAQAARGNASAATTPFATNVLGDIPKYILIAVLASIALPPILGALSRRD